MGVTEDQNLAALARSIIWATPTTGGATIPADELALTLMLEGGRRTIHELRDALGLPQATTSELVDRAEAAGRVERHCGPPDRRRRYVQLTPVGHRERHRARWRT